MIFDSQSAVERRERLREEGKLELPINVDTRKYLLSAVKYRDVIISLPFLMIGIVALSILHQSKFGINSQNIIICLSPWVTFLIILSIPHPDRKNISFFTHRIVWKLKFTRRQKQFVYSRGDLMKQSNKKHGIKDVREQLGITNIYSDCYETLDNRLVKVINVSSVNLSLLNSKEKRMIFQSYETFLNDLPKYLSLQISQIAQPINLKNYFMYIQDQTSKEENQLKQLLARGYLDFVDEIQKSKNMVSRNRYVIISKGFNYHNRDRVLDELEREAKLLISQIENMISGRFQLKANLLNNDELFHLIFTCIDYDNAQVNSNFKATISTPITVGEETYKNMTSSWEKEQTERIM